MASNKLEIAKKRNWDSEPDKDGVFSHEGKHKKHE